MKVRRISQQDASELIHYYSRNSNHLKEWEPERPKDFLQLEFWQEKLKLRECEMSNLEAVYFVGVDESTGRIIGLCSLTNIVYGAFLASYMGYSIDQEFEGRGYMKKLCYSAIDYAFHQLRLHRIMANYMPRNKRSASLLKTLGFVIEGEAKKYLKINGVWEDHILTSLTNSRCR